MIYQIPIILCAQLAIIRFGFFWCFAKLNRSFGEDIGSNLCNSLSCLPYMVLFVYDLSEKMTKKEGEQIWSICSPKVHYSMLPTFRLYLDPPMRTPRQSTPRALPSGRLSLFHRIIVILWFIKYALCLLLPACAWQVIEARRLYQLLTAGFSSDV